MPEESRFLEYWKPPQGSKLQDPVEFTHWWNEGKTYQWIVDEYRRKYNIEITPGTIGNWRARLGLERRQQRSLELVPWYVEPKHAYRHNLAMLRAEGRRRAGAPLSAIQQRRLDSWLAFMREEDCVVHYDPDTEEGFHLVPRRPGIDKDLVRVPPRNTRVRGRRD